MDIRFPLSSILDTHQQSESFEMRRIFTTVFVSISLLVLGGCQSSSTHMNHASSGTEPGTAAPTGGSYLNEKIPAEIASLPLFESSGKKVTLESFKGKWVVLTNFLTSCQEVCPMTTALMNSMATRVNDSADSAIFSFIEVSVDSKRDTPTRLAAYKEIAQVNALSLLSGSENSLSELWKYFGAPYEIMAISAKEAKSLPLDWQTGEKAAYDVMHPDLVLIISPDLHWRWINLGSPDASHLEIPEKLKIYLSAEGKDHLAKPQQPTWTSESVFAALHELSGVNFKS